MVEHFYIIFSIELIVLCCLFITGLVLTSIFKKSIEHSTDVQQLYNGVRLWTSRLIPVTKLIALAAIIYLLVIIITILSQGFSDRLYNHFFIIIHVVLAAILLIFGNYFFLHTLPSHAANKYLKRKQSEFSLLALEYSPTGRLKDWGSATRSYHAQINWLEMIYKPIKESILQIPTGPIVILSPSANNAAYEKWIAYRLVCDFSRKITFIASDQAPVEVDRTQTIRHRLLNFQYWARTKAENLHTKLAEKAIHTVDCLIDFKGILWHHITEHREVDSILHYFDQMLKPGGCIIIDAAETSAWTQYYNDMKLRLIGRISGYAEYSTFKCLTPYLEQSAILSGYSWKLEGQGPYRIAIFQKKGPA
ncbi:MAG: hypothetical protein ACE3L7_28370 [Candidatus Pristimantibacillus sp.]